MLRPASAFWRALHSLAHCVSLAALILLLVNDHYLRLVHPSWLTGKLGDFAWLVFAPFIAALFFAWVVPFHTGHVVTCPYLIRALVWTHHRYVHLKMILNHETLVGILSFTTIGLWFTLAKTVPAIHALTTTAWESIIGWQGTLRLDPTDLLTLLR